ncbi:MAG: flavodoxin family protein [Bacillota bacterium]|nr:flavodoxin family protein [Bacillota bacterium]
MGKSILILNGSPRKNGNSRQLSLHFQQGAEAAGHTVKTIELGNAKLNGCLACEYCRRNAHQCVQKDAMAEVYAAINEADTIVFCAPVYFYGLPVQIKTVFDRLFAYGPEYLRRDCLLLMTAGDTDAAVFGACELNYKLALLDYLHWQDKGRILVAGVYEPGAIKDNPALQQAYELGKNL